MIASAHPEGVMHFHIEASSLMGPNVSRPLATRPLAEWVQVEMGAA